MLTFETKAGKLITLIGSAIGIFGTIIGLYTYFVPEKVQFIYEVVSETNVLDINKDLSDLDVLYRGESLKQTNRSLKVIVVRIVNDGNKEVLKDYYDENDLPGIQLQDGIFIDPPVLVAASNEYIARNLQLINTNPSEVRFAPIILEPNDSFTIQIVSIGGAGESPRVVPIGKIAGVTQIQLIDRTEVPTPPLWRQILAGTVFVQLLRLLIYTIAGLLILLAALFSAAKFEEWKTRLKRKRYIREFRDGRNNSESDAVIFRRFERKGSEVLRRMRELLNNQAALRILLKSYLTLPEPRVVRESPIYPDDNFVIAAMLSDGIISEKQGELVVNQAMVNTLRTFIRFLNKKDDEGRQLYKWITPSRSLDTDAEEVS